MTEEECQLFFNRTFLPYPNSLLASELKALLAVAIPDYRARLMFYAYLRSLGYNRTRKSEYGPYVYRGLKLRKQQ